jgi:hypothetical protein
MPWTIPPEILSDLMDNGICLREEPPNFKVWLSVFE